MHECFEMKRKKKNFNEKNQQNNIEKQIINQQNTNIERRGVDKKLTFCDCSNGNKSKIKIGLTKFVACGDLFFGFDWGYN